MVAGWMVPVGLDIGGLRTERQSTAIACRLYFLQIHALFMAEQNLNTAPAEGEGDDLQAKIEELQRKNQELSSSLGKLSGKNEELIGEKRKLSRVERVLKAIDIDPDDEEAENKLLAKLTSAIEDQSEVAAAIQKATAKPPGEQQTAAFTPESLEMKSQLKQLQKKLADMEKKAKEAEEREQAAVEKRKRDYVELKVKEALDRAGCIQPTHLFKLLGSGFRLSDDGETVLGGPEHDPRSLEDQIEVYKDDNEFSMYFRGSGATGSGMAKGQGGFGGQSLKNPFRSDQLNVTEAAGIFQRDPEKAKRLILEARSAGKLDPKLAQLAG